MKGITTILVIILILLGIGGGYYLGTHYKLSVQPQGAVTTSTATPTPQLIGGDRDSHGCIGSAGYSWCEEKQKCIRSWEETCSATASSAPVSPSVDETASIVAAVKAGLVAEHGPDAASMTITVTKTEGNFAEGSASAQGGGGMWLAAKVSGAWKLAWDGNGTISCTSINPYNFPITMVPQCWDGAAGKLITR